MQLPQAPQIRKTQRRHHSHSINLHPYPWIAATIASGSSKTGHEKAKRERARLVDELTNVFDHRNRRNSSCTELVALRTAYQDLHTFTSVVNYGRRHPILLQWRTALTMPRSSRAHTDTQLGPHPCVTRTEIGMSAEEASTISRFQRRGKDQETHLKDWKPVTSTQLAWPTVPAV